MLPGLVGGLAGFGASLPVLAFVSGADLDTNVASYSFPAQLLGPITPGRQIVVVAGIVGSGFAARLITAISVGGVAASAIAQSSAVASGTNIAIFALPETINTSATIVVTVNAAAVGCGIAVYSLTGPATVYDNDGSITTASGGAVTANLDVIGGYPYLVAAMGGTSAVATWAFSAATVDPIQRPNTNTPIGFGHAVAPATATSYIETATPSINFVQRSIVGVSWQ